MKYLGAAAPAGKAARDVGPGSAVRDGGAPPRRAFLREPGRAIASGGGRLHASRRARGRRGRLLIARSGRIHLIPPPVPTQDWKSPNAYGRGRFAAGRSISMPRGGVRWILGSVAIVALIVMVTAGVSTGVSAAVPNGAPIPALGTLPTRAGPIPGLDLLRQRGIRGRSLRRCDARWKPPVES